ncbi:MAG TPA: O-antigen ligase family protein [Candidatus Dormibacteraeota bacterium]
MEFWVAVMVVSVVLSLPTNVHLTALHGLVNVRPWEPALAALLIVTVVTYARAHWSFVDLTAVCLSITALAVLLRSAVRDLTEAEPHFRVLTDWTGAPAWEGATKSKGVITSLLLCGYVVLAILMAGLVRNPAIGKRLMARACTLLLWFLAGYAALFLLLLFASMVLYQGHTTSWLVIIRGIDVGHSRSSPPLAFFGPLEGLTFATGATLASVRAASSGSGRPILVGLAVLQALAATLTFSRGAWIALLIGLVATLLVGVAWRPRMFALAIAAFAVLALAGFVVLALLSGLAPHTLQRVTSLAGGTGGARLGDWIRMLSAFGGSPIFGLGAEAYRPLTNGFPAENLWIEIAFSGGLLALVPLVVAHGRIARLAAQLDMGRARDDPWLMAAFSAFVVAVSGTFSNTSGWSPVYWLFLGLVVGRLTQATVFEHRMPSAAAAAPAARM